MRSTNLQNARTGVIHIIDPLTVATPLCGALANRFEPMKKAATCKSCIREREKQLEKYRSMKALLSKIDLHMDELTATLNECINILERA